MSKFNARQGLSVGTAPIDVIDTSGNGTLFSMSGSTITGATGAFSSTVTASGLSGSASGLTSVPITALATTGTANLSTFLRGDGLLTGASGSATVYTPELPSSQGDVYDYNGMVSYINSIAIASLYPPYVTAYSKVVTAVPGAYFGGVYSPTQNRIYFAPYYQSTATSWHYIDCANGSVVAYSHTGVTAVSIAYQGGVYSPTQNRIYFVPQTQATSWHYINCDTGSVVAYSHTGATAVDNAYAGGVYSPTQNRIYFVPDYQSTATSWHYIDCDPAIGTYPSKDLMAGPMFNKF